ncbi:MAG: hypothetical protein Q9195_004365 [Heterodermia aff. obscurata]
MEPDDPATDFGLPPPKRTRLGEQHADAGTPIDDADDLYKSPVTGSTNPTEDSQDPVIKSEPQQSKLDPPKFQLPGLGCGVVEGHSGATENEAGSIKIKEEEVALENKIAQNIQLDHGTDMQTSGRKTPKPDIKESSHSELDSGEKSREKVAPVKAESRTISGNAQASTGGRVSKSRRSRDAAAQLAKYEEDEKFLLEALELVQKIEDENAADLERSADISQQPVHTQGSEKEIGNGGEVKHTSGNSPVQTMLQSPTIHNSDSAQSKEDTQYDQILDALLDTHPATVLNKNKGVLKSEQPDIDAEFELDSSPVESSSDSSSDSSSSDDSDDYEMLDPEEQARRLMQEDGGSDGEGGQDIGAGKTPLRTLNEKPDEIVPKPNIHITPEMRIQELGDVENLVENSVLIKAKTSGEYQVLESGSVLCLSDRSVIGVVAETLGRVQQPYYSVRFTNIAGIAEAGISKGTRIFYSEQHSTTVFTQPLKAFKGSDASNLHDEEVADDEIEFSDDEAEAEYKKQQKQAKQARREGRSGVPDGFSKGPGGRGGNRGRGPRRRDHRGGRSSDDPRGSERAVINYDDMETDEPYIPLARPSNLHEIMRQTEAPLENRSHDLDAVRGDHNQGVRNYGRSSGGRGRGDNSRGHRGGRGDRRGRGGYEDRGNNAYSHAQNHHSQPQYPPSQMDAPSFYQSQSQYQPQSQYQYGQHHDGYQPSQYAPQTYGNLFQASISRQSYYQNQQPSLQSPVPNMPPGAFINPAFFAPQAPQNPQNSYSPYQSASDGPMPPPINNGSTGPASSGTNPAFLAAQERLKLLQNLSSNARGN